VAGLGIPLRVIPESKHGLREIVQEASEFLAGRNVAVIHSHRYKENLIAVWVARRCGVPHLVRTQHGLPEPQTGLRAVKQGLIRLLDLLIARRATDRVISVSDEMTGHLVRSLGKSKVVTIPNGLDPDLVHSKFTIAEAKARLGLPPKSMVIGSAGRLERIKRLDIFIRAAAVMTFDRHTQHASGEGSPASSSDVPQIKFVIAGEGREGPALAALAKSTGLEEKILFLGFRDDIHDVIRAFDILVLSSDHEGLPMVLLEALAEGIPVVARAVGGIPQVIRDSGSGVLVDSDEPRAIADACLNVLAEHGGTADRRQEGAKYVRAHFSARRKAEHLVELYASLCHRL